MNRFQILWLLRRRQRETGGVPVGNCVEKRSALKSSSSKLLGRDEPPDKWEEAGLSGSISLGSDESDTGNLSTIPEADGDEDEETKSIFTKHLVKTYTVHSVKETTRQTSETESDTSDEDVVEAKLINVTRARQEKKLASNVSSETEDTSKTSEAESSTSDEFEDASSASSSKHVRFTLGSFFTDDSDESENSYLTEQDEHANAMETLFQLLTSKNDMAVENRQAALRMGAPQAVVRAMRENKSQVAIQKYACRCLAALCWNKESVEQVLKAGGLETTLCAFYYFPNNISLQRTSCKLIGNMWKKFPKNSSANTYNTRQEIADAGGLMAVIDAMKCHPKHRDVQRWGCYALQSLLRNGNSFVEEVVMAGGVDLIILAMNNHLNDIDGRELQLDGCRFLYRVAKNNEEYRDLIIQAKGLVAIGEVLRVHGKDASVQDLVCKSMKVVVGLS